MIKTAYVDAAEQGPKHHRGVNNDDYCLAQFVREA